MKYLIKNASVSLGGKPIIEDINFEINDGNHVGIVGKNGSGKTTFIKCLIDNSLLEEGIEDAPFEIKKIGSFSIGYQSQITFPDENITLIEELEKAFSEIKNLEKKINNLESSLKNDTSIKTLQEYTTLIDRFKILGGYSYQKEYEVMLHKFGFTDKDKTKKLSSFSGGEKSKIAFIKLLLSKPDLLLLDEPTNHLDIDAIIWLEDYLKNYKGAFVLVSHDQMFLNNTVNTIYDISHGIMTKYSGNFEYYEKQKKLNYEKALKDYEAYQKEVKRLNDLYLRFRFKPTKAGLAMSRLKKLEKMETVEKPQRIEVKSFKGNLKLTNKSGKEVLRLKNLEVGYDKPLANIDLEIMREDRLAIIGANGSGKSTLLKTIKGDLKPLKGSVSYGYGVNWAYFDQNINLDENKTILEQMLSSYPDMLEKEARSALGAFLFTGLDVNKKISVLSGGEKVRLSLCIILLKKPNLLLLDEPTNHLDIESKSRLEDILSSYEGTLIFVSHDRYFVKKLATKLIVFSSGSCTYYPYGYDEYLEKNKTEPKEKKIDTPKKEVKKENITNNKETQKEIKSIEKEIKKSEETIKDLNNQLLKEEVYSSYEKSREISKLLENENEKLESLYQKWETLQETN